MNLFNNQQDTNDFELNKESKPSNIELNENEENSQINELKISLENLLGNDLFRLIYKIIEENVKDFFLISID